MDFALFIVACLTSINIQVTSPKADTLHQQGIEGVVYRKGGNRMPAPNRRPPAPAGAVSTVYIYELTNDSQTLRQGTTPYYRAIYTRFVCQVDTDSSGNFHVSLPPGNYSIFTKKGDLFYASQRDEKNNIAPVTVSPGKMSRVQCSVESDHKPLY